METELKEKDILQIELYKYEALATKRLVRAIIISVSIALFTTTAAYYFLAIQDILIQLSVFLITTIIAIVGILNKHLFPPTDIVLIIAFDELQLMRNNKIIWQEQISKLDFILNNFSKPQIPIITIKGTTFLKMSIGYGNPKTSSQQINYLIFSKLDWEILLRYINQNSLTETDNLKLQAEPKRE